MVGTKPRASAPEAHVVPTRNIPSVGTQTLDDRPPDSRHTSHPYAAKANGPIVAAWSRATW